MTIFFNVLKVRNYLIKHGFVYTVRKPRATGIDTAVYGNYFNNTKICNVIVKEIGAATPELLKYKVKHSGFKTAEEWIYVINKLKTDINKSKLYKVKVIK